MAKTIITIGRQFGSNGRNIGRKLAEKISANFYDKELINETAKESGLSEEFLKSLDEKPTRSFLYSLVSDPYSYGFTSAGYQTNLNQQAFQATYDTIKKLADKGPSVFVGRCADYALRDYSNVVNAFIYADIDDRIKRIAKKYELTDAKAKDLIRKEDKSRASYYNYYTSKRWGEMKGYDICLNSSQFGIDNCVDMLYDAVTKY